MTAYVGSKFFPAIRVYDSKDTTPGMLTQLFEPYAYIADDSGNILYQYGNVVPSMLPLIGISVLAVIVLIIALKK